MTGHRLLGIGGTAKIKIIGACPEDFLTRITALGVRFRHYRKEDELTAHLVIPRSKLKIAEQAAVKTMCTMELIHTCGILPQMTGMKKRWILPVFLLLLVYAVFFLQSYIWFFTVTGNETIPSEKILRTLEECGVEFGTKMNKLDLNILKNQMLSKLPELGWITINTKGGIAEVVVRQRAETPVYAMDAAPANIVARKNGLITSVVATGGSAAVKAGDLVTEGQLLVSGVTNLDKTLLLTRAKGEVYARTWTPLKGISPVSVQNKVYTGEKKRTLSLTFGKKKINFYKTSRISYGSYDRISEKKTLTLPGGYTLPVSLTVSTLREYHTETAAVKPEQASAILEQAVLTQLKRTLTAGRILSRDISVQHETGYYSLVGEAECYEEIGTVVKIQN